MLDALCSPASALGAPAPPLDELRRERSNARFAHGVIARLAALYREREGQAVTGITGRTAAPTATPAKAPASAPVATQPNSITAASQTAADAAIPWPADHPAAESESSAPEDEGHSLDAEAALGLAQDSPLSAAPPLSAQDDRLLRGAVMRSSLALSASPVWMERLFGLTGSPGEAEEALPLQNAEALGAPSPAFCAALRPRLNAGEAAYHGDSATAEREAEEAFAIVGGRLLGMPARPRTALHPFAAIQAVLAQRAPTSAPASREQAPAADRDAPTGAD